MMRKDIVQMDFAEFMKEYMKEMPLSPALVRLYGQVEDKRHVLMSPAAGGMRAGKQYFVTAMTWFEKGFNAGYEKGKEDAEKE